MITCKVHMFRNIHFRNPCLCSNIRDYSWTSETNVVVASFKMAAAAFASLVSTDVIIAFAIALGCNYVCKRRLAILFVVRMKFASVVDALAMSRMRNKIALG